MGEVRIRWASPFIRYSLIGLVLTLLWVIPVLIRTGDPLTFVAVGTRFDERDPDGTTGYDGQFSYYIARDGLIDSQPHLDNAAYRLQRIGFPLLTGLLSVGDDRLVPYIMLIVNVLSIALATGLLAVLLGVSAGSFRRERAISALALTLPVWVGSLWAVRLGLNEPLCILLGLTGLMVLARSIEPRSVVIAAILFALSMLVKDMGVVFIAAAVPYVFFKFGLRWAIATGLAVLPYALWYLYLRINIAIPASAHEGSQLSIVPLAGYLSAKTPNELAVMVIWLVIPALVIGVISVRRLLRGDRSLWPFFGLFAALWTAYLPTATAFDLVAAYRVALPLIPAGLLVVQRTRDRVLLALFWALIAIQVIITPGFLTTQN